MKQNEQFALAHFLSVYPSSLSFQGVLKRLIDDEEDVEVWMPFKDIPRPNLYILIDEMAEKIADQFYPVADIACIIERAAVEEMLHSELGRLPTLNELDKVSEFIEERFCNEVRGVISDAVEALEIPSSPNGEPF